ncbi:MAG: IS110 family transposase [Dethiobacter sp.]|jgi:transposase|nr:MAG: IS110 family transposase [Dethiobacter sp.]
MHIIHERCCGLDVHKKTITACIITPKGKVIRTFGTMTGEILELADWIKEHQCTHVAMESTGVYWKPIYNLLELAEIEAMVVNAQHIKAVPGCKTDVKDAEWIADLLRHGLLKGSYIPSRDQRELRELVRYRKSLIEERAREVNWLQKVLEGCNIKLSSVVSDIMGASSRSMIEAIINNISDPKLLSKLAKGSMKSKRENLEQALHGLVGPHQRKILAAQLRHIDFLDEEIKSLDEEVGQRLRPFEEELELLDTIPGVGRRSAESILAEVGTDMDRFPSAAHLASWAGMSPGSNESAGKRKSGKTTKGNKHLRSTLVQCARAASRSKETYLSAQYHRIAARRGGNRAAVAVGHSILVIAYHILKNRQPYHDLGANYFDERKSAAVLKSAVKRIQALGYTVIVEEKVA